MTLTADKLAWSSEGPAPRHIAIIMDGAAIALARDNRIPIIVFSIKAKGGLADVLQGRGASTKVAAKT